MRNPARKHKKTVKGNEQLDRSIIRLYLVYQTSVNACLIADIDSELDRRCTTVSPASVAQLLRGLQGKGYVSEVSDSTGRKMFRATALGRRVVQQLGESLRSFMAVDRAAAIARGSANVD